MLECVGNEDDDYFVDAVANNHFIINLEEGNTVNKEHVALDKKYILTFEDLIAETDLHKPATAPATEAIEDIIIIIVM